MAISATINRTTGINASMSAPQGRIVVTKVTADPATINLRDLSDINLIDTGSGAMIAYNANTEQWDVSVSIQNPNTIINGGHF